MKPLWPCLLSLCLAAPLLAPPPVLAESPTSESPASESPASGGKLTVELNKLEPAEGGGCRAYFLFRNETGQSFEAFQLSLAILDGAGVIDRLLSVEAAPLPVARTTLKLFDIEGMACPDIAQILVHDIPACTPQNGAPQDCFPLVQLRSRAAAGLVE